MRPYKIAIFASGRGTNAEKVMEYFQQHAQIEVVLLFSNKAKAFALERAKKFNIPVRIFNREEFEAGNVLQWLGDGAVTHIVLAGFLWLIPTGVIQKYPGRIINIHPALLPKYGGKGMYGMKVHEAVKAASEEVSGITIHLVSDQYDEGKTLFQAKCAVNSSDSPEEIAEKIHQLEHRHYPTVIEDWIMKNSE